MLRIIKPKIKDMTPKQLVQKFAEESDLFLMCYPNEMVYIELRGKLAQIPNIKRGRVPSRTHFGRNFINKSTMSKIRAMDILFNAQNFYGDKVRFKKEQYPLCVLVQTAPSNRKFDVIGVAESVLDWLEPADKAVGKNKRGWGVGVIEDDTHVIPIAVRSEHTECKKNCTTIVVLPFSKIKNDFLNIITNMLGVYGT